ncbi:glycosyltransferase family 4 protein [Tautonia marina]|uniref:glycosyltransferase family 4 protein n=1 Tax=Tautonia marina TaxID=2653855 RepID=UPI00137586B3|nr:glycosyltransferase family 4 protein [Tautonia marina]
MAVRRIGIALPLLGISGGINIVLNWGVILAKAGYGIDLILPPTEAQGTIPFLSEQDGRHFRIVSLPEARQVHYHTVMATWWACIPWMADLDADHYAWFMQAVEGQFAEPNSEAQQKFDEVVSSQMNVITTAHWLRRHIERHYTIEPKQTFCVLSGLDKTLWREMPRVPPGRGRQPVRFLVEGPPLDPRKNVAQTIRLLEGLKVPYRWVGATVDHAIIGPHCQGVEVQVPYHRMPSIYADSDVLVKASNAEGMFGPPLEMFATGGTAVCWDVQGAEEYMADRYNCRLTPMNSWSRLAEAIREFADNPEQVRTLQENALATAEAWPTWDDQADQILATIEALAPFNRSSLIRQVSRVEFRDNSHRSNLSDHLQERQRYILWLESEVARRDRRIGNLWAEVDAREQTLRALRAEMSAGSFQRAVRKVGRIGRAMACLSRRLVGRQARALVGSTLRRSFQTDPPVWNAPTNPPPATTTTEARSDSSVVASAASATETTRRDAA